MFEVFTEGELLSGYVRNNKKNKRYGLVISLILERKKLGAMKN